MLLRGGALQPPATLDSVAPCSLAVQESAAQFRLPFDVPALRRATEQPERLPRVASAPHAISETTPQFHRGGQVAQCVRLAETRHRAFRAPPGVETGQEVLPAKVPAVREESRRFGVTLGGAGRQDAQPAQGRWDGGLGHDAPALDLPRGPWMRKKSRHRAGTGSVAQANRGRPALRSRVTAPPRDQARRAMSHFTRLRTRMVDRSYLEQALIDLGHQPVPGPVDVRGYEGGTTRVDLKIPSGTEGYDIGFAAQGEAGGAFEIVADWWGIKDTTRERFAARLNRRYAYTATVSKLAEQGFDVVSEEVEDNGQVHLLLRRAM